METRAESQNVGLFDERYLAFIKTAADIRASLHRYCSRMTGSIMDGEDLVQDTLFQAYQKISMFDASRPLKPWLFRIAHNLCIDFLRRGRGGNSGTVAGLRPSAGACRQGRRRRDRTPSHDASTKRTSVCAFERCFRLFTRRNREDGGLDRRRSQSFAQAGTD